MAGHSKWKNIQHRKGKQDAQRGKLFNRLTKEIFVAVRQGGDDPETNIRLRAAIQKARQNNMPNSNIDNAIKKAAGNVEGVNYEEIVYEGYGPSGVAVMVQCLTDNRNRTAAEVRHIFAKNGGNLGESGCVSFLFEQKGIINLTLSLNNLTEDELMLEVLDAGAEDLSVTDDEAEVTVAVGDFEALKQHLDDKGIAYERAEVSYVPATTVALEGEDARKMLNLMQALEDCDDVQDVHANFDIDEQVMQSLA